MILSGYVPRTTFWQTGCLLFSAVYYSKCRENPRRIERSKMVHMTGKKPTPRTVGYATPAASTEVSITLPHTPTRQHNWAARGSRCSESFLSSVSSHIIASVVIGISLWNAIPSKNWVLLRPENKAGSDLESQNHPRTTLPVWYRKEVLFNVFGHLPQSSGLDRTTW